MMIKALQLMAEIVNLVQTLLRMLFNGFGIISDKQQHFWVIGIIGVIVFLLADVLFKQLAKWSISTISFVFALMVVLVIVFGLEIVQMVTGTGMVEFGDVMAGIWGFLVLLTVVLTLRFILKKIGHSIEKAAEAKEK
jgi:bacteriorhodopsin